MASFSRAYKTMQINLPTPIPLKTAAVFPPFTLYPPTKEPEEQQGISGGSVRWLHCPSGRASLELTPVGGRSVPSRWI